MRQTYFFFLVAILTVASACSKQWRESKMTYDDDQVVEALRQSLEVGGYSAEYSMFLDQALQDPLTVIYIAESGQDFGPAASVLNSNDYSYFGLPAETLPQDLENATVYLIESVIGEELRYILVTDVQLKNGGARKVSIAESTGMGRFENDTYQTEMAPKASALEGGSASSSGNFIFATSDLEDRIEELRANIQIQFYATGQEISVNSRFGKVPQMIGFGR